MVLFYTAIKRDLVSLLRFTFLAVSSSCGVQSCRKKYPYSCCFSHSFSGFCCFSVWSYVAIVVISLFLIFLMYSLNPCIDTSTQPSMLVNSLPPFLNKHRLYHYYYYYYITCELFTLTLADGLSQEFEWHKSPQISKTHLSILADLNNAVVWMIWIHSLISNSSNNLSKPLGPFQAY